MEGGEGHVGQRRRGWPGDEVILGQGDAAVLPER